MVATLVFASHRLSHSNAESYTLTQFSNYGPNMTDGNLESTTYRGMVFAEWADFGGNYFSGDADFQDATFAKGANFEAAVFGGRANFTGVKFTEGANFCKAYFHGIAYFSESTFSAGAIFEDVRFGAMVAFTNAIFEAGAIFDRAEHLQIVWFTDAYFANEGSFIGAEFRKSTNFERVTFVKGANFVDVKMHAETNFDNASFMTTPPLFDGAHLHEGVTFFGIVWPICPQLPFHAKRSVRAYARLKLEMDKLKKHDDELDFFALELRARRVLAGKWSTPQGWTIGIYGFLCDHGRSYDRPFALLLMLTIIGAVPFLMHFGMSGWRGSLAFSFSNTFAFFQFSRQFFEQSIITGLPWTLKLISEIQTVVGTVLLFLFGLGLRNRFRMR